MKFHRDSHGPGKTHNRGRPFWVDLAGVLIGAGGLVVAILALGAGSGSSNSERAELKVVDTLVHDVERGPEDSKPRIEMIVHNTGGKSVVIDGAEVEVRSVYALPRCASQDDLPVTRDYEVHLKANGRPGEVVETRLHQEVGADEADRFALSFSTKPLPSELGAVYIFEIQISLKNDGPEENVEVGRAVITLPALPTVGEYYWGRSTVGLLRNWANPERLTLHQRWGESMPCWRRNTTALHKVARISGAIRSSEIKQVLSELVQPSYAAIR